MKKIYVDATTGERNAIYFDFAEDFPQLGCWLVVQTGGDAITDCSDVDGECIDTIQRLIDSSCPANADAEDYAYMRGLIAAWGL